MKYIVIDNDIHYDDIDELDDETYEYLKKQWIAEKKDMQREYWNSQF